MKHLKIKIVFSSLMTIFLLQSCSEDFEFTDNADTFFHVNIDNTVLPIWVRGNTASNKILVYINGGPGLTSLDLAKLDTYKWGQNLETDVAIAYYDQRGTGNAQGNFDESSISMNQYVKDLNAIVTVLKNKYPNTQVYLMSHSFGSAIAVNYLLEADFQDGISGWISVDGAFNFDYDLQWVYRRDFLINIALEEIEKGNNTGHWNEALNWANENDPILEREQKNEWGRFMYSTTINIIPSEETSSDFGSYLGIGFSSSYNVFPAYTSNNLNIVNNLLNQDVEGDNYIQAVSDIAIPSLLIWGRYDDLIPPELGNDVYRFLGTPEADKELLLFDGSGHEPMISSPDEYATEVIQFIENY
ncbi:MULTISPECIES: alpha/beta fold hydrolase [Flavobacteriaceae]|uniref:alpha/beta fold hydrolase n=1 Tax=Flavobacteriaceae TaxID=49546 RepID=UPI001492B073|nr:MULTISPECIES: alpha/beta hydrolase [Allomuricauda]MDC6366835.1 alpha/beta hydrolase [Muricauda sp. AC10]